MFSGRMNMQVDKYRISKVYIKNTIDAISRIQELLQLISSLKEQLAQAKRDNKSEIERDVIKTNLREAYKSLRWHTDYVKEFIDGKFHDEEKIEKEEKKLIPKEQQLRSFWICTRCGCPRYDHATRDYAPACWNHPSLCHSFSQNQKLRYGKDGCEHKQQVILINGRVFCSNSNCYADVTDTEIGKKRIADEPMLQQQDKEFMKDSWNQVDPIRDVQITRNVNDDSILIEILGDSAESGRIEISNYSEIGALQSKDEKLSAKTREKR